MWCSTDYRGDYQQTLKNFEPTNGSKNLAIKHKQQGKTQLLEAVGCLLPLLISRFPGLAERIFDTLDDENLGNSETVSSKEVCNGTPSITKFLSE